FVGWRVRREPAGSSAFNFGLCFMLVVTVFATPIPYTTGQVLLLPAMFLVLENLKILWATERRVRLALVGTASLIGWQWIGSFLSTSAAIVVPIGTLRKLWIIAVGPVLFIPLTMLVLYLILYRCPLFDHREDFA